MIWGLTCEIISIDGITAFGTAVLKLSVLLFVVMMSIMLIKMTDDCNLLLGRGLVAELKYSGTSVHERPCSRTIRFTNKFSEQKISRMTNGVSDYEHASCQQRQAASIFRGSVSCWLT
jgi:hypothetical protein